MFVKDSIKIIININGKKRGEIEVAINASKDEILAQAKQSDVAKKWTDGKEIVKEIVVPNKLVNIVVKG